MKSRQSKSLRVLGRFREKSKTLKFSPVVKSGRYSFRVSDYVFKVAVKAKGKIQWKTIRPNLKLLPSRRVRIKRGENKGRLRRISARHILSGGISLPKRHLGSYRIFFKGKRIAHGRIRKDARRLTPRKLKKDLQGGGIAAPKIRGIEAEPVRAIYKTWDPLLGQLPQAAWWVQSLGIFFNIPSELRRVRGKYRVWFIVELPPETVAPESFKMYSQTPTKTESVFYLTFFVIEIDRLDLVRAADVIRSGPLFFERAEASLNKHNENDADHPWLSVRAFVGIEGLG